MIYRGLRKLLTCIILPLLPLFSLGIISHEYGWWPANHYERAQQALVAHVRRARMIEAAKTQGASPEHVVSYGKLKLYKPRQTYNGYTLISRDNLSPVLVDMSGNVVHRWFIPFYRIWKDPPHIGKTVPEHAISSAALHAYRDGSLLMVMHGKGDTPYGYGLVKLDANSQVLWSYPHHLHHDVYVAKNGDIYALSQYYIRRPIAGLEYMHYPTLMDVLVVLDANGKLKQRIPILDAINGTRFEKLLREHVKRVDAREEGVLDYDATHINSIEKLEADRAAHFPQFNEGDILISIRSGSILAVVDSKTEKMKWAIRGGWKNQHDAHFMDDGSILFFDNEGPVKNNQRQASRILRLDPFSKKVIWRYPKYDHQWFYSRQKGEVQQLPNGNIMINSSWERRLIEISPSGRFVWSLELPYVSAAAERYSDTYFWPEFCKKIGCKKAGVPQNK